MKENKYISILFFSGIVSWSAWIVVIFKIVPRDNLVFALLAFFVSLFVALISTFSILGMYLRSWFFSQESKNSFFGVSFRQGILLSFLVVFSLMLELMNLLNWFTGAVFIALIMVIEFYFVLKTKDS